MSNNRRFIDAFSGKNWWKSGLIFGLIMLVFNEGFLVLITEKEFDINWLPVATVTWLIGGLLYGYAMKWYYKKFLNKGK